VLHAARESQAEASVLTHGGVKVVVELDGCEIHINIRETREKMPALQHGLRGYLLGCSGGREVT